MKRTVSTTAATAALGLAAAACGADPGDVSIAEQGRAPLVVTRTDIVADEPGALARDTMLVNAWGLAFNPDGIAWVAATETGVSALYDANGTTMAAPVTIPSAEPREPSSPTGQVYNADPGAFGGDSFVFVSEEGTISGWQPTMGGIATQRVDNSERRAVYKGVTIVSGASGPMLLAADFRGGKVDVFDATYAPVETEGFVDTELPEGFVPFNVEEVNGEVVVTYALKDDDGTDDVSGAGNGFVNLFDADGTLLARLVSGGELDSPWGVALAPPGFGAAPNHLLVGNFGDGLIHAYRVDTANDPVRVTREGALVEESGMPLRIDGLWALKFGPDAGGFSSSTLYFTAGPASETHGRFGRLETRQTQVGGSGTGSGSATTY